MYSLVRSTNYTFAIFDMPNDAKLPTYINKIVKTGPRATVWVHACDRHYDPEKLLEIGVFVYDLQFPDGRAPPKSILDQWSKILKDHRGESIAVHCVAGLGRAPVLVAVAMIEDGWGVIEAITEIRKVRPGALNLPQIRFLESYKPSRSRTKPCLLL